MLPKFTLHEPRTLGFVILCPDRNVGGLKNTVASIRYCSADSPCLCVVGDDATEAEIKEMGKACRTLAGKNTITSLINHGIRNADPDWNAVVFAGGRVNWGLFRKFDYFADEETDVLFPVVDRKLDFAAGSLNGMILNKKVFEIVGQLPTCKMEKTGYSEIELVKQFWAMAAVGHGVVFKGVVGMNVL